MKPMKPDLQSNKFIKHFSGDPRNLYKHAENWREGRILGAGGNTAEQNLKDIAEEIRIRVKITQQEIYFIGEMLTQAKAVCKISKINYKDWVEETFDFGYHTANNFCNVYTACIGQLKLIQYVKPSVLYKISSKQFPKDLRDILLFSDIIGELSVGEVREIYEEFQEKGWNHVKQKLEKKANLSLAYEHSVTAIDNLKTSRYNIEKAKFNLTDDDLVEQSISSRKGITKIGDKINIIVSKALDECLEILDEASSSVGTELQNIFDQFNPAPVKENKQSTGNNSSLKAETTVIDIPSTEEI